MLGFGEAPLVVKGPRRPCSFYRAKCCNPIPGDEIVGYITRGAWRRRPHSPVSQRAKFDVPDRNARIAVEWGGGSEAKFPVQLTIRARDRAGLLAEITAVISSAGSNIHNLESQARSAPNARN